MRHNHSYSFCTDFYNNILFIQPHRFKLQHLLYLQPRCKMKVLTRKELNARRDLNVHIFQSTSRAVWRQLTGNKMNTRKKKERWYREKGEFREWGEWDRRIRQSWFSFSNKSDNPPVLLWRPPLSPFLSASYHLSLLPFSQQGMWVCVLLCVGSWMNQANEGESH